MRMTARSPQRQGNRRKIHIGPWVITVAVVVALTAARWIAAHPALGITLTALVAAAAITVAMRARPALRARKGGALTTVDPHRLKPDQFEHFIADLCRRDKCRNVRVVGGAGDLAADVLYTDPHGRRGLIQAKRYQRGNSVGSEHVQMVNGTYRDAHHCQHAAIVTTSHFTRAAAEFGHQVGIRLVDDHRLTDWINGQRSAAPWN
ncbi:restriction endonuclease [Streptomyces sp. NPDC059994]|uniref:restriction endonuclease n=1 Tax=Streptomyces sp. NPDC059994 TaxID=3347029 RepID=UPI00367CC8F2